MPVKEWCSICNGEMLRAYLRVIYEKQLDEWSISKRRGFKEIGWYCEACKYFRLDADGIIEKIIKSRSLWKGREWSYLYVQRIYLRTREEGRK